MGEKMTFSYWTTGMVQLKSNFRQHSHLFPSQI